ncbi:MAG: hypothetical protein Q9167_003540 [Letrouitia subvulpina]
MSIPNPKMYEIRDEWIPPQGGIIRHVNVRDLTEPERILFYNMDILYSQSQKIVSQNEMILSYLRRTQGEIDAALSARPHNTPNPLPGAAETGHSKYQSLTQEVADTNLTEENLANIPTGVTFGRGLNSVSGEQALSRNATNNSYIVMSSERSIHFSTESDLKSQALADAVPPLPPKGSSNHSESEEPKARSNKSPQPTLPMQDITKNEYESSNKLLVAAQASSLSPALALSKIEQMDPSSHAKTSRLTTDTSREHSPMGPENPNEAQKSSRTGISAQLHENDGNQLPYVQRFQKKQQSFSATSEKLAHPTTPQPPILLESKPGSKSNIEIHRSQSHDTDELASLKYGSALDELQGLVFEPTPPASELGKISYTNAGKGQSETKPLKDKGQGVVHRNKRKQTVEKEEVTGVDANFLTGMFQTEMESIEYYKPELFGDNNSGGSQAPPHRNAHLAEMTKQHVTIFLGRLANGEIEPANYDDILRFVTALQDRDYKTAQSLMTGGLQARASGPMKEEFSWMKHLIDLSKAAWKRERKVKQSQPL